MPSVLLVGDQVTFDYREGVMVTDASFKAGGERSPKPKKQKHTSEQEKSRSGFFSQSPTEETNLNQVSAGGIFKPTDSWFKHNGTHFKQPPNL